VSTGAERDRGTAAIGEDGMASGAAVPLPPLRAAGIVVHKRDLIAALRVYVPGLRELQVTEDGDYFWLMLGDGGDEDDQITQARSDRPTEAAQ
jgi:hypothetical protein